MRDTPLLKRFARPLLTGLGTFCVILGFVGAVVPLLPSTVFFIVAAWCFARGNPRLHRWLRRHPLVGPPLRNWREGRGLSARAKTLAVVSITLTFALSIGFVVQQPLVRVLLGLFAVGLITYLLRQPTSPARRRA
ncbi:MAG: hypothetical protein AVDCRST_MAG86-3998 [uncultured Truepera sp.]|uniref:Inner membrane protein YbaN n=1 Tax=uncultured Truepera sp. TaxID=543023 RepID=A0A6J4VW63_9DEIN|nr:MAG: hypothetical protein AVDCRST_MAG86-3998 [uncultured Truepera sp.]